MFPQFIIKKLKNINKKEKLSLKFKVTYVI